MTDVFPRLTTLTFCLFLSCPLSAIAQATGPGAPISNADIIKLIQAGLPEPVIINKIKANPGAFDTSTDALIALKKAGATDRELAALTAVPAEPAGAPVAGTSVSNPNAAVQPSLPTPGSAQPAVVADNAGPSLQDAMKFLVSTPDIRVLRDPQERYDGYYFYETYDISTPASCTLSWRELEIYDVYDYFRNGYTVHLADIDPNTITVTEYNPPNTGFNVTASLVSGKKTIDHSFFNPTDPNKKDKRLKLAVMLKPPKSGSDSAAQESSIASAKVLTCFPDNPKCKSGTEEVSTATFFAGSQVFANRYANALKQAAILCGAKSASAF